MKKKEQQDFCQIPRTIYPKDAKQKAVHGGLDISVRQGMYKIKSACRKSLFAKLKTGSIVSKQRSSKSFSRLTARCAAAGRLVFSCK